MSALEVIACGAGTSVQDAGRFGWRRFGVSVAGAMDGHALAVANALVGNPSGAAAVEIALSRSRFRVLGAPVMIAVGGPGATLEVAGLRVPEGTSVRVGAGCEISVGPARDGVYAYLAVSGGVLTEPDLGSRAFHRRSGLGGAPLTAGTCLPCGAAREARALRSTGHDLDRARAFRLVPGPQAESFAPEIFERLLSEPYSVSRQFDRMALRLDGPLLPARYGHDIVSDGVVPGSIQVPGDGQPIVLMRDCQTTGGYPKIATVISADLGRLAQVLPGRSIRFRSVTLEEARQAMRAAAEALAADLERVEPIVDLDRTLMAQNLIGGVTRGDDP